MPDNRRAAYGLIRQAWQPPPYARGGYSEPGGTTLGDLMGHQGRLQAERHLAGSNMLAQGVRDASQQIAGYFGEKAEKQEMAKREAATLAAIEGWDGQDPMELYKGISRVRGPADSLQFTNTVLALRKGQQKDPEKELERFGKTTQFLAELDDATLSRSWPKIRESLGPTALQLGMVDQNGQVPEQWDPALRPFIQKAGETFGPTRAGRKVGTLSPGAVAFDEATGEIIAKGAEKPEPGKTVKVPGPDGRPMEKTFSAEEMAKGVTAYQEPRAPTVDPAERAMQWATDPTTGEDRLMTNAEIRKAGAGRPDTADMRNKAEGRKFVSRSITAIKGLSERVITKRGVAQRATAAGRTVESVLGNDAEFRTYQDARKALAGNLAVAQQGSRPSDADIQSIWLPMVPDVFRDTDESAKMKWDLINTMSLPDSKPPGSRGGGPVRVQSLAEARRLPSGTVFIDPNGRTRRVP